jgi:hypothetical protein
MQNRHVGTLKSRLEASATKDVATAFGRSVGGVNPPLQNAGLKTGAT